MNTFFTANLPLLLIQEKQLSANGLPRNSVVRISDCPDMTSAAYFGCNVSNQTEPNILKTNIPCKTDNFSFIFWKLVLLLILPNTGPWTGNLHKVLSVYFNNLEMYLNIVPWRFCCKGFHVFSVTGNDRSLARFTTIYAAYKRWC